MYSKIIRYDFSYNYCGDFAAVIIFVGGEVCGYECESGIDRKNAAGGSV